MAHVVTIRDAVNLDRSEPAFDLRFLEERITVRELIRSRVFQEVKDFNARRPDHFRGLVQPTDTERTRDGFTFKEREKGRFIDWQEQFDLAVTAFEAGGFLVVVDDAEVTGLDTEIVLGARSEAVFLKLMPLVGG